MHFLKNHSTVHTFIVSIYLNQYNHDSSCINVDVFKINKTCKIFGIEWSNWFSNEFPEQKVTKETLCALCITIASSSSSWRERKNESETRKRAPCGEGAGGGWEM